MLTLALLVMSVSTLVQAVVETGESQFVYIGATTISHVALLIVGYSYNEGRKERHNKFVQQIRQDILGE